MADYIKYPLTVLLDLLIFTAFCLIAFLAYNIINLDLLIFFRGYQAELEGLIIILFPPVIALLLAPIWLLAKIRGYLLKTQIDHRFRGLIKITFLVAVGYWLLRFVLLLIVGGLIR